MNYGETTPTPPLKKEGKNMLALEKEGKNMLALEKEG